ncbi:hypothetical protein LIER_28527 [Lithospermum erythrorhizon]|uniref:Uncharacterized protein n=1 Tax=Lithospermum erythrorhizon TaxID=34254 RepID=A0AAV3RK89_LITER
MVERSNDVGCIGEAAKIQIMSNKKHFQKSNVAKIAECSTQSNDLSLTNSVNPPVSVEVAREYSLMSEESCTSVDIEMNTDHAERVASIGVSNVSFIVIVNDDRTFILPRVPPLWSS